MRRSVSSWTINKHGMDFGSYRGLHGCKTHVLVSQIMQKENIRTQFNFNSVWMPWIRSMHLPLSGVPVISLKARRAVISTFSSPVFFGNLTNCFYYLHYSCRSINFTLRPNIDQSRTPLQAFNKSDSRKINQIQLRHAVLECSDWTDSVLQL